MHFPVVYNVTVKLNDRKCHSIVLLLALYTDVTSKHTLHHFPYLTALNYTFTFKLYNLKNIIITIYLYSLQDHVGGIT